MKNFNNLVVSQLPRFDFDKYGSTFEKKKFKAEEATEQDIIDGMVTTGCPFAFMIDQINLFTQSLQ